MTTVTVVEQIAASADDVWAMLSDFGGIKVGGPIQSFEVEGEGVGAVRTIGMGAGQVIERLDVFDPAARTFAHCILNEDCPLPVSGYSAKVVVTEDEQGCSVEWSGEFDVKGGDEEASCKVIRGIYTGGIASARKALTS